MSKNFLIVLFGTWFIFMIMAIFNAVIREVIYNKYLTELRAHQLSTITFILIIFIVTFIVFFLTKIQLTDKETFIMGSIWFVLTICFEFLAGHFAFGNSWDKLLADYNLLKGRVWMLVPLTTFLAPYIVSRFLTKFF